MFDYNADMSNGEQQSATHPTLTPSQEAALQALLIGNTVTAAAQASGVDRTTVHRWLKSDPEFRAAYNRKRMEMRQAQESKLLAIADLAIDTLDSAVRAGDVRAAIAVAKGLGLLTGTSPRIGEDDPDAIRRRMEQDAAFRQIERSLRFTSR